MQVDTVVAVTAPTIEGYKAFLTSTLASAKSLHDGNMAHFTKAKETYFEMVEKFADWASATLSPTKAYHASVDTLKATVAAAKSMADPKKAIDSVHAAYTSVASLPAVAAALATGTTTLTKVHDTVVAAPLYKAVVDTGAKTLSYATSTSAFKVSQDRLYPLVAPYAAPAVSAATPYLQSMMTYWAPVATA